MAAAETARLIASLELKDKLSPGVKTASAGVDKLDSKLGRLGASARRGAGMAGKALLGLGAVAAVGITAAVKTGIEDLATLEDATTSVDGAIKQLGLTGQVTASQIATWANEIEAATDAAFDDKAIVSATSTLIRFGHVTADNVRPAMEVITDLAVKTGDVDSAASLLAKALADPTKAAGKLARSGVILTKQQQKNIEGFVKAGKAGKAQALILDALAKSTDGAAKNMHGPVRDALNLMNDAFEDGRKALAIGFLPVLKKVSTMLSAAVADPKTRQALEDFGTSLSGAFDDALEFAKTIPWGSIGNGLGMAAGFAKDLFNAFRSMPPEVQATLVALAGIEKVSGGALSGFVGELGKFIGGGLKQIFAAQVTVIGKSVIGGGGGLPVTGGKGGGIGGALGTVLKVSLVAIAAEAAIQLWGQKEEISRQNAETSKGLITQAATFGKTATTLELENALKGVEDKMAFLNNNLTPEAIAYQLNIDGVNDTLHNIQASLKADLAQRAADTQRQIDAWAKLTTGPSAGPNAAGSSLNVGVERFQARIKDVANAVAKVDVNEKLGHKGTRAGVDKAVQGLKANDRTNGVGHAATREAARGAGIASANASSGAGRAVVNAINSKDMSPTVTTTVTVNVTPSSIQKSTTTVTSYGNPNGSSGGGRNERQPV